jgi:hypothetical protein
MTQKPVEEPTISAPKKGKTHWLICEEHATFVFFVLSWAFPTVQEGTGDLLISPQFRHNHQTLAQFK